jgi:hypothetical protein
MAEKAAERSSGMLNNCMFGFLSSAATMGAFLEPGEITQRRMPISSKS